MLKTQNKCIFNHSAEYAQYSPRSGGMLAGKVVSVFGYGLQGIIFWHLKMVTFPKVRVGAGDAHYMVAWCSLNCELEHTFSFHLLSRGHLLKTVTTSALLLVMIMIICV